MKLSPARWALGLMLAAVVGWPMVATIAAAWAPAGGGGAPLTGGGLMAPVDRESEGARVPRPVRLAATSAQVVAGTLLIALPLGVPLGLLFFRTDLWGRRLGIAVAALLVFVPLPLVATAWLGAIGNAGRAQALGLGPIVAGRSGAAFLQAMAALPWIVLLSGVGFRAVEPELEEAALLDLPAWRVVASVTLRRSLGVLAGAALAVAVIAAGDMTVTDLLQVRTYAEEAYIQYQLGRGPEAAAAVTLLPLGVLGTLVVLAARALLRAEPARLPTAAPRAKLWRLGAWRVPLGLLVAIAAGPVVAVPLYSLLWWAGRAGGRAALGQGPSWSLAGLAGTLQAGWADAAGPLRDSLICSLLGATATVALAWPLAWVSRVPGIWRAIVAALVALCLATPGPVVGMALVLAYLRIPLVFDSVLIIVLADVIRTLPYALLVLWPAIRTIPPAWLDAAAVDGYSPWGQIRRVALPATRDATLAAWGVAFVLALGELPATNLVAPPGTTPLPVVIWGLLHSGVESQLAGVALVLLAAIAIAGLLASWALARMGRDLRLPPPVASA